MRKSVPVTGWRVTFAPNETVKKQAFAPKTVNETLSGGFETVDAAVPGNFELDLMRAGRLPDLYYGDNVLKAQKLENMHLWYTARFDSAPEPGTQTVLTFGGIDTAAEIFLDGGQIGFSENMFVPFTYALADEGPRAHEIVVHILPAVIYARGRYAAATVTAHSFNDDSVKLRKAPYMYGWDIMPRIVSAGLWKPVTLETLPLDRIEDVFVYPWSLGGDRAEMRCRIAVRAEADLMTDYRYILEGACRDSVFRFERPITGADSLDGFAIEDPYLWYPKNYGEPDLYDVTATLVRGGTVCDTKRFRIGLRIVELEQRSPAGPDGEFLIRVNDKKIFCMGSNLVPTDAFPSRIDAYTPRQNEMLKDLGCNIARCWGGSVYPGEAFYDFCDENGILVWQDFAMACARYPEDLRTLTELEREVRHVVRRFRNHPSIAVWAGDNECDSHQPRQFINGRRVNAADPNDNLLTRGLIPFVLRNEDHTRPYVPSSPYVDPAAFAAGSEPYAAEQHLWGPRDFFKGDFYMYSTAHFASETGYHGCPSPDSLKKFLSPAALGNRGTGRTCDDPEWMLHSSTFRIDGFAPYNGRIPLMIRQTERLFGYAEKDLAMFALQSQISQAEAKKFFIEHFRAAKWRRTGIIWWNLIDGWPQVSDAVADWYGTKKLAYSYIKRSQQPFCLLFDEPSGGLLTLKAANDTPAPVTVSYRVRTMPEGETAYEGTCAVSPGETEKTGCVIPETPGAFYLIEWEGDETGRNHYTADICHGLDLKRHLSQLKAAGFLDALEGFSDLPAVD